MSLRFTCFICCLLHSVLSLDGKSPSQDLHLPWRTTLLLLVRCTEQIVLAALRLCQYFSTLQLSWWGICQCRNTIYYDRVNDQSSLVWKKTSIPGIPWSSQEKRLSEAQGSLNNPTDSRGGFLYWFPHSRVGDMQTGFLDANFGALPQINTNLVGPQCALPYSPLCLASAAKCWTKRKRTKIALLGLMGFCQSAYPVIEPSHISNGHPRKQQISMEEQTSDTL